jgi:hypothetical protein
MRSWVFTLAAVAGGAAAAATAEDATPQGEELKAAAIAKFEDDIEEATKKKAEAARSGDREAVKTLAKDLRGLRLQLSKAKAQSPEQYAEEEAERVRVDKEEAERVRVAEENAKAEAEKRWKAIKEEAILAERAAAEAKRNREAAARPKVVSHPMPAGVNPIEVVYAAQSAVKLRLKNPSGAKFPGIFSGVDLSEHCRYNGDGTYTVTSWVDATNSFGGRLRVAYVAVLKKSGDAWAANEVVLLE